MGQARRIHPHVSYRVDSNYELLLWTKYVRDCKAGITNNLVVKKSSSLHSIKERVVHIK